MQTVGAYSIFVVKYPATVHTKRSSVMARQ